MLPSPYGCRLGPRGYSLSRPQCVHCCYGPVTRGLPWGGLVDRLQSFSFHHLCYPNYGALTLTPAGLSPAEHASLRWTHNRACTLSASTWNGSRSKRWNVPKLRSLRCTPSRSSLRSCFFSARIVSTSSLSDTSMSFSLTPGSSVWMRISLSVSLTSMCGASKAPWPCDPAGAGLPRSVSSNRRFISRCSVRNGSSPPILRPPGLNRLGTRAIVLLLALLAAGAVTRRQAASTPAPDHARASSSMT